MAIARLLDLIILPGLPEEAAVDISIHPEASLRREEPAGWESACARWDAEVSGTRIRRSIECDDALRRFFRENPEGAVAGRALHAARRAFCRTIESLVSAGVDPVLVDASTPVSRWAAKAWAFIEQEVPGVAAARSDLWCDLASFGRQDTAEAVNLRGRIHTALNKAFGPVDGVRTIVHHGFYYFTPPQWALFQRLAALAEVEQIFVVHDDATNPVFETWRRYFQPRWEMPKATVIAESGETPTPQAHALKQALAGHHVDAVILKNKLRVLRCGTPAEFVRTVSGEISGAQQNVNAEALRSPRIFAADVESVSRLCERLNGAAATGSVDLAKLPVGAFLLGLHDCIHGSAGTGVTLRLSPEDFLSIVSSGYLPNARPQVDQLKATRLALPYFIDCVDPISWLSRADMLRRLVSGPIERLGPRKRNETDAERIATAAANPLRMVPWADLTADEAETVYAAIKSVCDVLGTLVVKERIALDEHLSFIKGQLRKGMEGIPQAERELIEAKLKGLGSGLVKEVDADGLVDVVNLLLGRTVPADVIAGDEEEHSGMSPLRALDVLALERVRNPIHLANLSDGAFPARAPAVPWPFTMTELAEAAPPVAIQLIRERQDTASLGDLYLLWLALDGVQGSEVTLSWIRDLDGIERNPSPVVMMLASFAQSQFREVAKQVGGLEIVGAAAGADVTVIYEAIEPSRTTGLESDLDAAIERLNGKAATSALICPRRFALQWLLGPTAAFAQAHHHRMLMGNVHGALVQSRLMESDPARVLCDELWSHLTPGERESSMASRVVTPTRAGAKPEWILTLAGGRKRHDLQSRAYVAALEDKPVRSEDIVPNDATFLPQPPAVVTKEVCINCPVLVRCSCFAAE